MNEKEENARQCVAEFLQEMKRDKNMSQMILNFIYKVHPDLFASD